MSIEEVGVLTKLTAYVRQHHVALLALFVALGGTSYAAVNLPAHSVGNRELKKNAVRSPNVLDGSLLAKDFKAGQLPRGQQGPQGPGAIPIDLHLPPYGNKHILKVNGVDVVANCTNASVVVSLADTLSPKSLMVDGFKAENETVTHIDQTDYIVSASGTSTADLDVIASDGYTGKWTRFDLGSYFGGSAGCNFFGLITPPS